jgi:16S rRNA (guanine527-N7)-methyltransferase
VALTSAESEAIENLLARSRSLGFLGPGSVRVQVDHALGFTRGPVGPTVTSRPSRERDDGAPHRVLDLGSGGGVPGLVLALAWREAAVVLLDAASRRVAFLADAVTELGLDDRVTVVHARAEAAGRDPGLRGAFDVVVARGFGPPPVTAECGAPFLVEHGRLLVSDPPIEGDGGADDRWPAEGLALVGLAVERTWSEPFHYRSLVLAEPCPDRYPRRDGIPAKRPLF